MRSCKTKKCLKCKDEKELSEYYVFVGSYCIPCAKENSRIQVASGYIRPERPSTAKNPSFYRDMIKPILGNSKNRFWQELLDLNLTKRQRSLIVATMNTGGNSVSVSRDLKQSQSTTACLWRRIYRRWKKSK